MHNLTSDIEPVSLPIWPTCKNALTWSAEALAVAAGEAVHILTPRDSSASTENPGNKQWHIHTVRVNQFDPSEWPPQALATVTQFSLGEELSESTIVSIAWSPAGLGVYRRSVLTILTSNLVLSLWETTGRFGVWQRTAVVNQHLSMHNINETGDNTRCQHRVRAFAWLPSFPSVAESMWGRQLLAVADDSYTISVYHVSKRGAVDGQWSFRLLTQYMIPGTQRLKSNTTRMQSLRTILTQSSPISSLEATAWQGEGDLGDDETKSLGVKVSRGQCCTPTFLRVLVRGSNAAPVEDGGDLEASIIPISSLPGLTFPVPPSKDVFAPVVEESCSEFVQKHGLRGKVRVNHWGTALSPGHEIAAACVSLHPSDMIEYVIPSAQRVTLHFIRVQESLVEEFAMEDPVKVQKRIFEFMLESSEGQIHIDFDRKIIRNTAALMKLNFKDSIDVADLVGAWLARHQSSVSKEKPVGGDVQEQDTEEQQEEQMNLDRPGTGREHARAEELCEFCDEPIPFTSDFAHARCNRGHQFSRCWLSFVAIQEPGISKYCSKCGRQFLDLGKMEFQGDGPSLGQALFDRFDACPYCQGKYRG
ncbi:hypothetical protein A1O7_07900 [Cladophialophora yegresii CBS 114405]|uniref:Transcription factor IIIC putative zinc-finger domain-containing protein n=1 Tax=Cladophialophora yegresii CBS 114405 TaxID=1182544 RepID=W9VP93_9EURO|nr:uncharacterized protein A1O7_07900 [Cladophialophora yegresii CBS 114405]EXJ57552.1 hypothetical protein A1O7_07900 [Cladophialophora yegresii CBS 114405]